MRIPYKEVKFKKENSLMVAEKKKTIRFNGEGHRRIPRQNELVPTGQNHFVSRVAT